VGGTGGESGGVVVSRVAGPVEVEVPECVVVGDSGSGSGTTSKGLAPGRERRVGLKRSRLVGGEGERGNVRATERARGREVWSARAGGVGDGEGGVGDGERRAGVGMRVRPGRGGRGAVWFSGGLCRLGGVMERGLGMVDGEEERCTSILGGDVVERACGCERAREAAVTSRA
jgi:hypothetical protein